MPLRSLLLGLYFVVMAMPLFAQPKWEPSFKIALESAKAQQKLVLLNFSGSDWCIPCMLLRKDFFSNSGFLKMADSNIVLVNADFPVRKKNMPVKEIKLQNNMLAEKYNKSGNFPFTVLLNANGELLKIWNGIPTNNVQAFTQEIRKFSKLNKGG